MEEFDPYSCNHCNSEAIYEIAAGTWTCKCKKTVISTPGYSPDEDEIKRILESVEIVAV